MNKRVLRVVLTGSESTGKSTLAAQLGACLGAPWSAEFSREYAARKSGDLDADDVGPIACGQQAAEDAAIAEAAVGGMVIHDADLLSTLIYARHYYQECPAWIEALWEARRADLYLLLDIDLPWVADDVRDRGGQRKAMQALFLGELERRRLKFCVVRGVGAERLEQALRAIEELSRTTPEPS